MPKSPMPKVLITESRIANANALMAILKTDPEIQVIGVAATEKKVMELIPELKPDIVIISESLPNEDSLEIIRHIMAYNPTPILLLTDPDHGNRKDKTFKAISMGALDVIEKPIPATTNTSDKLKAAKFVKTVKSLSKIKVVTHVAGKLENIKRAMPISNDHYIVPQHEDRRPNKVVAIAASTGGPSALVEVLRKLPGESSAPVLIVQHVAEGFTAGLAEWLDRESGMSVKEAQSGDLIIAGHVFVAPTGSHMVVTNGGRIMLNKTPPVEGHRPSANVLFASVAEIYGDDSIGVVLTGMGSDGARGIVAMKNAGGKTIAQDQKNCVVFGMPKAAIQTGAVDEIVPLDSIAERIIKICDG